MLAGIKHHKIFWFLPAPRWWGSRSLSKIWWIPSSYWGHIRILYWCSTHKCRSRHPGRFRKYWNNNIKSIAQYYWLGLPGHVAIVVNMYIWTVIYVWRKLIPSSYKPLSFFVSLVYSFYATGFFLYPLKALENPRFSDVFRGYRKRLVAENGLKGK